MTTIVNSHGEGSADASLESQWLCCRGMRHVRWAPGHVDYPSFEVMVFSHWPALFSEIAFAFSA